MESLVVKAFQNIFSTASCTCYTASNACDSHYMSYRCCCFCWCCGQFIYNNTSTLSTADELCCTILQTRPYCCGNVLVLGNKPCRAGKQVQINTRKQRRDMMDMDTDVSSNNCAVKRLTLLHKCAQLYVSGKPLYDKRMS